MDSFRCHGHFVKEPCLTAGGFGFCNFVVHVLHRCRKDSDTITKSGFQRPLVQVFKVCATSAHEQCIFWKHSDNFLINQLLSINFLIKHLSILLRMSVKISITTLSDCKGRHEHYLVQQCLCITNLLFSFTHKGISNLKYIMLWCYFLLLETRYRAKSRVNTTVDRRTCSHSLITSPCVDLRQRTRKKRPMREEGCNYVRWDLQIDIHGTSNKYP